MIKQELATLTETDQTAQNAKEQRENKILTEMFNNLIADPKRTATAIHKQYGRLTLNVGSANTLKEFFKEGCGIVKNPFYSPEKAQIEQLPAFQKYKAALDVEGFDVDVSYAKGYDASAKIRVVANRLGPVALGVGLLTMSPIAIIGAGFLTAGSAFFTASEALNQCLQDKYYSPEIPPEHAHIMLEVRERKPLSEAFALENKSVSEQAEPLALEHKTMQPLGITAELSKMRTQQAQKQMIIK